MILPMKIITTVLKTIGISEEEIRQALSGPLVPRPQTTLFRGELGSPSSAVRPPAEITCRPSQVYLLLDISGSMDEAKLAQARRGGAKFAADAISRGYRGGVIQFSSWASLKVEPTENRRAIEEALSVTGLQATTNMAHAIKLAAERLGSGENDRAIVLVTDGFPDSEEKALTAAERAKRQGITIITIGTDDADRDFLSRIASAKGLSRKVKRQELHVAIADSARLLPARTK